MDKVHFYVCSHTELIKSTYKLGFFLVRSTFLPAPALRSAIEWNESGGYVIVPSRSKMTQRSSTANWLKF